MGPNVCNFQLNPCQHPFVGTWTSTQIYYLSSGTNYDLFPTCKTDPFTTQNIANYTQIAHNLSISHLNLLSFFLGIIRTQKIHTSPNFGAYEIYVENADIFQIGNVLLPLCRTIKCIMIFVCLFGVVTSCTAHWCRFLRISSHIPPQSLIFYVSEIGEYWFRIKSVQMIGSAGTEVNRFYLRSLLFRQ